MAKRITAGSLVCMSRRKIKGQGIVIQRVININDYAEFDLAEAWLKLNDKNHKDYFFKHRENYPTLWALRRDVRDSINEAILRNNSKVDVKLLNEFWSYNNAYSNLKGGKKILTPKIDFSLIMWFKSPSDYGDSPSQWFKNKQHWLHTKMLKSIP
jgi:hypothetical protein